MYRVMRTKHFKLYLHLIMYMQGVLQMETITFNSLKKAVNCEHFVLNCIQFFYLDRAIGIYTIFEIK